MSGQTWVLARLGIPAPTYYAIDMERGTRWVVSEKDATSFSSKFQAKKARRELGMDPSDVVPQEVVKP